jgi:hypothetical protein
VTVRRGEDWGSRGPLAPDAAVVTADADLIDAVVGGLARRPTTSGAVCANVPAPPEVGLMGGDLHRTLGSPRHTAAELREGHGMRLPIDICAVELLEESGPNRSLYFCAHLVATEGRGRLFAGRTVVAMNAAFRGEENLAPRAHPGDGLIDTLEGSLGFADRVRARRRLVTGTHVPHPSLTTRRVTEAGFEFSSPTRIVLDGRDPVHARVFRIRCLPDAVTVVI